MIPQLPAMKVAVARAPWGSRRCLCCVIGGHVDLGFVAAELKRRRVIRAVLLWGVVAFAVLQIFEAVMHGLHLPEWTLSFVVVVLGLGFPVTVALAWVFDLTARGVDRSPAADIKGAHLAVVLVTFGLLAAAAGIAWHFVRHAAGEPSKGPTAAGPSIAVLSFADMSPAHDQEYFADGVAEEILNALGRVDGLRVPGRTSSFYFKGKSVRLAEIGRELSVKTVLQGSVRKEGNRLRVAAQLVGVDDEAQLWSETYDRELTGILSLQDEIATAVVAALKLKLLPDARLERYVVPDAYNQYLLGRHLFFGSPSPENMGRALEHFERAVTLDPRYAPAWAFLSYAIIGGAQSADNISADNQQRALTAAEKAIALAREQSVGYLARAYIRRVVLWDWAGAQADIDEARRLRKNYLQPQNSQANLLASLGRVRDAVAFAREATELDPLNVVYWRNLGVHQLSAGELGSARAALTHAEEISPQNGETHAILGLVELIAGSPAAALPYLERNPQEFGRLVGLAVAYHDLGRAEESQRALDTLIARYGAERPYRIAQVHAWRGERDPAFEWLARAYDQHNLPLRNVKSDPLLRRVRDDARFAALLKKMNLPAD